MLGYHAKEHVIVFGNGSYHGRQDDIITDMKKFDGKGIAIVSREEDVRLYAKYFDSFSHIVMPVQATQFHLGLGVGFNYELYNQEVLQHIRDSFYKIPEWLPSSGCYMYER